MLRQASLSTALVIVFHTVVSLAYNCSSLYNTLPDDKDLKVFCGTTEIQLEVNLCSAQWAGYEPADLALNGQRNISQCLGSPDTSVDPPVIRYQLSINQSQDNPCRQMYQIVDEVPDASGYFSSFSSVSSVIITGYIDTPVTSNGIISYTTGLYYHFSCRYPLEYLLNNTKIVASSVSVAVRDNNGTFLNTLSMNIYNDTDYIHPLVVPPAGLALRSKVYVEVKSTNLTGNFNLLLDHCFATSSLYNNSNTEQFDLLAGCVIEQHTSVTINGLSKNSRFSFEAFRFMVHRNLNMSTIYVHCFVRLCEPSKCLQLISGCSTRTKRHLEPLGSETGDSATVSVGPLYTSNSDKTLNALAQGRLTLPSVGLVLGVLFGNAAWKLLV
ncbi:hypothetical protein UPYG_G00244980 [Umbra pygmaea]|uniref:ZP domain-containing protein n=1 Tax=Umbra pygmaea TaxID=75934 RepID=A0ABD0X3Y5_UMBPY